MKVKLQLLKVYITIIINSLLFTNITIDEYYYYMININLE